MTDHKVTFQLPKGKKGFTVNFRHPIQKDRAGKYGLKVHRGLGTSDKDEAEKLVKQLENMMDDEYWHNPSKREEAYDHFSPIIVDAFYDPMEAATVDNNKLLDRIHLPGKAEGYSRSLFVGPSGAGKTSLIRLLAGTGKEKFPTTSTGRTTTCNMELIMSEDDAYEVVVVFMSRYQLEMYVQENIEAAVEYCMLKGRDSLIVTDLCDKLLIHRDLALRLAYILGDLSMYSDKEAYSEFDEEEEEEEEDTDGIELAGGERNVNDMLFKLVSYIETVKKIADELTEKNISLDDEECHIEENDEVLSLRNDIVEEAMKRFQLLTGGEKLNSKGRWVNAWYYKTCDRAEFMKTIKRFTSNSKTAWGTLLTPLVKTMRVKGRFKPISMDTIPRMVLFDGQGLGHKTTLSSIPSETYQYFPLSDSIILVDNAEQPMLENVKIALKGIIEYGKARQLMFAFTHMDGMKGDNLKKFEDRKRHVTAAVNAYLEDLRRQNKDICFNIETEHILGECYFFSRLDKKETSKVSQHHLELLLHRMKENHKETISLDDVALTYDAMTLYSHLQSAIQEYRITWSKKLGYPSKDISTEHWSRIKALSRRLAYFDCDHYNYVLMPLADFRQEISASLNIFINRPLRVLPIDVTDELKVEQMNRIKVEINNKIADFITEYMWKEGRQFQRWIEAYQFAGRYSTYYRAEKINEILEFAAPRIDNFAYNMTDIQKDYIAAVFDMIEKVLNSYGCKLERFKY